MKNIKYLLIKTSAFIILILSFPVYSEGHTLNIAAAPYIGQTAATGEWVNAANWSPSTIPDPGSSNCTLIIMI
jgi:hypothetical protein